LSRTPRQLNPDPGGTPIDPEVLKRLISGREPAGLDRYIMQVRTNVAYSGGSGLIDLGQFRFGIGRQLVDEVEIPDHNTYITLDEYLVDTYRRQMGFSPTSREIANNLLAQHPRTELFIALIGLNRVRKLPDALAQLEAGYLTKLPPGAADVYRGLMSDTNQPRFFLARQLILLAIREALTYTGPTLVTPTLDPIATAVMLTHALGTDLQYTGGGISLWEGMTSGDLMGIVQNAAFHAADDVMSLLDRHWRVWIELGESAAKEMPRAPFQRMAREAIGLDLRTALMLGLALKTRTDAWRPPSPLVVDAEFVTDVDPLDLEAFLQFTTTSAEALTNDLASTTGAWEFLPLERSPILRVEDKLLVIDETYLLKRVTDGIYLAVADMEGPPSGSKPRRAWSKAYSEVVEVALENQIQDLAPNIPVLGGSRLQTYFSEEQIRAAYVPKGKAGKGHKVSDAAIWLTADLWLVFEIVNGELKVPSRQGGDMDEFAKDTDRLVIGKLAQLDATTNDLILDDSKLTGLPRSKSANIQPILVQGGHFPVHPVTKAYIDFRMKSENLLLHRGRVLPLAILHWEELEILEAAIEQGHSIPSLFQDWRASTRKGMPFKNWISVAFPLLQRPKRMLDGRRLKDILGAAAKAAQKRDSS
jgi:hypothetical protein